MKEIANERLNPDEVGEVLRRYGVVGARFEGRPTVATVTERVGQSESEIWAIVVRLRSLGTAIDLPSGDLGAIRAAALDAERDAEDPLALARVAAEYDGVELEGGTGRLPKTTRLVLIVGVAVFILLLIIYSARLGEPNPLGPR